MFKVKIVNRSKSVDRARLKVVVKAIDKQLRKHFFEAWKISSCCFLEGSWFQKTFDAVIYLDDSPSIDGAGGYHDYDGKGIPKGYVFLQVSKELGEPYSVTLSHEVLELVLNQHCNYYAIGKNPDDRRQKAAIWLEACDPVQDQCYQIDTVMVSDFVFPFYFTPDQEKSGRNNWCSGYPVESFGVTAGGYIGFYDFERKGEFTFFADSRARKRHGIKQQLGRLRRKTRLTELLTTG